MTLKLRKKEIEKFSRQIVLKDIGTFGQKKILNSKVLIVGMGGLGCPVAEFLTRSGIGTLGIVDHDIVSASNIHRQSLYDEKDLNKLKVKVAQKKLKNIANTIKDNLIKKYVSEFFLEKIAELTPHSNQNKKKFFVKETKSLDTTKKHYIDSQSLTGVELHTS